MGDFFKKRRNVKVQKWERCRGYMCTTRLPQLWIGAPTRIVCMCDSKYMKMAYTTFVSVRGADTIFDAAYIGNMLCMHACACFCLAPSDDIRPFFFWSSHPPRTVSFVISSPHSSPCCAKKSLYIPASQARAFHFACFWQEVPTNRCNSIQANLHQSSDEVYNYTCTHTNKRWARLSEAEQVK